MGLDLVELAIEAGEEFGVPIDGADVPVLVGELYEAVVSSLRQQHPERFDADPDYQDKVWQQLRVMISKQLGVDEAEVVKTANFVTDLGCV